MRNWTQIAPVVLIASMPFCFVAANGQGRTTIKSVTAQAAEPKTYPYHMEIVAVVDAQTVEWIFVIGRSGFKSVDTFKKGVSELPANSILEFNAGGLRFPNEPLSSEKELADFKKFCESKNVKLVLIPGR